MRPIWRRPKARSSGARSSTPKGGTPPSPSRLRGPRARLVRRGAAQDRRDHPRRCRAADPDRPGDRRSAPPESCPGRSARRVVCYLARCGSRSSRTLRHAGTLQVATRTILTILTDAPTPPPCSSSLPVRDSRVTPSRRRGFFSRPSNRATRRSSGSRSTARARTSSSGSRGCRSTPIPPPTSASPTRAPPIGTPGAPFASRCASARSRTLVGIVGLEACVHLHRSCELGYWLARSATGRGLMTEAARARSISRFIRWAPTASASPPRPRTTTRSGHRAPRLPLRGHPAASRVLQPSLARSRRLRAALDGSPSL